MADGRELASYQCRYGDTIEETQIPEIPEKDGYYGVWPEFDSGYVTCNATLEAQYEKWVSAIASAETDENGRSKLMAEGEFLPGTKLEILEEPKESNRVSFQILVPEETVTSDKISTSEDTSKSEKNLAPVKTTAPLKEYTDSVQVRVLCEDTDKAQVEVKKGEVFEPVSASVMGSYLVFEMDAPGTFRVTYPESHSTIIIVIGVCTVLGIAVIVLVIRVVIQSIKRKRHKMMEEEKNNADDNAEEQ